MAEIATITVDGQRRVYGGFGAVYLANPEEDGLFSTSFAANSAIIFEVLPGIGVQPFATATQLDTNQQVAAGSGASAQETNIFLESGTGASNNNNNNNNNGDGGEADSNGATAIADATAVGGGAAVATAQAVAGIPSASAAPPAAPSAAPSAAPTTAIVGIPAAVPEPTVGTSLAASTTAAIITSRVLSSSDGARTTILVTEAAHISSPVSTSLTSDISPTAVASLDDSATQLSAGAIAGIVIGVAAFVALHTMLGVWLFLSHRRRKAELRQRSFTGPMAACHSRNTSIQSELSGTMVSAEKDATPLGRKVAELPSELVCQYGSFGDGSRPIHEKSSNDSIHEER